MADKLEQLTAKLLEEQQSANKKEAADRQLQKIKDTNEIEKQNKILEKLDSKKIQDLQKKLAKAQQDSDKKAITKIGEQLKKAGIDKFVEATAKIESIEESQKFSKKVEAERSKDMQRIDAMKTSVERMKDEAIASGKDASKDRVIKDAEIKIRKEEFGLRVKNLEGTDRQSAFLEELGNDLKDKGLDPEKNKKFQKESIKLQKAELRERLKNAESPSERIEILKEQSSKDRKALSLSQKTLLGINNIGKSIKDGFMAKAGGAIGGVFGLLKKAALIGLLVMLPKILNSQEAKDFVKYMEETGIPAIKNFFIRVKDFFLLFTEEGGTAKAFGSILDGFGQAVKDVFDPNVETSLAKKLAIGAAALVGLKLLGIGRSIAGFVAAVTGVKALFNSMTNKIDPTKVPKDTTTPTTKSGKPFGDKGKNLTKYERKQLNKQGLAVNKAGQVVDAKDMRKKASADKLAAAMKKFPNYGRIAKIAGKLGPVGKILTGAFLVNELISGKSPAELAPQIAGLFTGLAGAGLGATAGAALGTIMFPGIGTIAGLGIGTILGGLGGDMLGTALAEYALGLPLTGSIGKAARLLGKGGIGKVDNATTPDERSSMGSYGQAAVSGGGGGSSNLSPVTKDASAVTPTGGSVDDFGGVGNVINNNQIIDASSRSNTSSYQLGNGAITSGNGLLKAVSETTG